MQRFRNRDQQAVEWMARRLSGTMSPEETDRFKNWLKDDTNRTAYNEVTDAAAAADGHANELLGDAFEAELSEYAEAHTPHRRLAVPALAAMAATLVAAFALGFTFFSIPTAATANYATGIGDRAQYVLADGSTITLNTNSQIDVLYEDDARHLTMESGEILFDVARAPQRPFIVETTHGSITVTGTTFNIFTDREKTTVSVLSGAVDVRGNGRSVTLLAGQSVSFDTERPPEVIARFNAANLLAWREGRLRFQDTPLAEVTAELNRYFQRPILLDESVPADAPLTGEFDITDQATVIRALTVAFNLDYRREPGQIVLTAQEDAE